MKHAIVFILLQFFALEMSFAQNEMNFQNREEKGRPVKEYNLAIEQKEITLAGVTADAMTINGLIPGPVLEFTDGDLAIINVTNKMDVETSVHWHGLILPNFFDGVPYLTTPPIKSGETFQYRIPINQSGTFWYHSHTMLQEQKGIYGSIVIQPKVKTLDYDEDLVIVLSDWTDEKAENVLRNLKRGSEWYQIKKGTAVPLSKAIIEGGFFAQLKMWRDRMEGADIADIYYPAFLSNGQKLAEYPEYKPGTKVRLRLINASASTYFWVDFGSSHPTLISSDGIDVQPVNKNRFLFAIAETFDFIITIPDGKLEIIATAQDGSGFTSIHLGTGKLLPAKVIERPDKVAMMKIMAKMDMKMGAPSIAWSQDDNTPKELMQNYGMKMKDGQMNMHSDMNMSDDDMKMKDDSKMDSDDMDHSNHNMEGNNTETFDHTKRQSYFNYDYLKAKENTAFNPNLPVNELLLNLTGNMNRYVWSINGVPLSETDKISIKGGEVTRITLNNLTMMHHPMHLHGHYFRVVNKNGERSPLKHTVNVPPMQKVTIEFYNAEYGDWFFHCHILYHMMGGMARVFSYDTPRDERMKDFPIQSLIDETNEFFSWGLGQLSSNYSEIKLTSSSIRNEFSLRAELDYKQNGEAEFSYNRYLNDWVRFYAAVNTENKTLNSFDKLNTVGLLGIKYFTPYMFHIDISMDNQLRPRLRIDREILLFPRLFIEGEYEYRYDFGWVNELENSKKYEDETQWLIRASYMLSGTFSIQGNYNNKFGWGGGLTLRL